MATISYRTSKGFFCALAYWNWGRDDDIGCDAGDDIDDENGVYSS